MNSNELKKLCETNIIEDKYVVLNKFEHKLNRLEYLIKHFKDELEEGAIKDATNYVIDEINNYFNWNFMCKEDKDYLDIIDKVDFAIYTEYGKLMQKDIQKEYPKK